MKNSVSVVLIGDSDISRWPPSLYPSSVVSNLGQSGATLSDLLPQLHQWLKDMPKNDTASSRDKIHIFVACAGENDIGSGRSVDGILETFRAFIDGLPDLSSYLLFLGPKFEPWLSEDFSSRKQYTKLSNALQRTIRKHPRFSTNQIIFVDCLTMFCTKETSDVPGAVHGGKALPDKQFFNPDGLHLSEEGYGIWKHIILDKIDKILTMGGS